MPLSPPPNNSGSANTQHGKVYFYTGSAASIAVMNSAIRLQASLAEQQSNSAQALVRKLSGGEKLIDPITIATIVIAVTGIVSATAAIAGTAASAAAAGAGIAGLALGTGSSSSALEMVIHNDTPGPLVNFSFSTGGASVASTCRPLLPGTSGSIDLVNTGKKFDTSAQLTMGFLSGGGVYDNDGEVVRLTPISSAVKMAYTDVNGQDNWVPQFSIDGSSGFSHSSTLGLSALYFQPNDGLDILPFTIACYSDQQSTSSIDLLFMPGSSAVTN